MIPIVTVVVTVYKRTQFIQQALQSVLEQSFRNFEIIVTDDSQSEAIRALCDSIGSSQIRYRTNPTNLGVALNLRAAIEEAQGKYIAILNDDDCWETDFLEKLVETLEQYPESVLAFSDHWVMLEDGTIDVEKTDENTTVYKRNTLSAGKVENAEDLVLQLGIPLCMASVFRKEAFDLNLLVKEVSGAYDFWIACLLVTSRQPIYYVNQRLTRYRLHPAMETSRKSPDKNQNTVFIYQKLIEWESFSNHNNLLRARYSESLYQVGRDQLMFDQVGESRNYLFKSFHIIRNTKSLMTFLMTYLPKTMRVALKFTQ